MKVLFVASECAPIVKVGGLADVVGSLPKVLAKLGLEVAVALPHYDNLESYPEYLPGSGIPVFYLGPRSDYAGEIYPGGDQERERFANFSRQIVNFLETRQFEAEILHLNDYHTSLVPDILKERNLKLATVLTIHDVGNQGLAQEEVLATSGLNANFLRIIDWDLKDRNLDMLLQGILGADVVNTVSPTYAKEIFEARVSGQLAKIFEARQARVFGILNGLDESAFDPRLDKNLFQNYGPANFLAGKSAGKEALQAQLGLKVTPVPLLGVVTRLVERKGIDLILEILPRIFKSGGQLVVLGKGERKYEEALKEVAQQNPNQFAFINAFDESLSHKIYGSSDFFLVPSITEPCGLTQMIACRFGSLPIVHATGGLADTVFNKINGYVFEEFESGDFGRKVEEALAVLKNDPPQHQKMVQTAMAQDFSWEKSAKLYVKLYEKALQYSFGIARGLGGEIRRDFTGSWTILSGGRAKRPFEVESSKPSTRAQAEGLKVESTVKKESILGSRLETTESELEKCPFEAGKESISAPEVFRVGPGNPGEPNWEVRVVANKYPLLPLHEVIIYSPDHNKDLPDLPILWVEKVVWTYLSRYRQHEQRGYVHLFCNHGPAAAASLGHPHSQLVVMDNLPFATIQALQTAEQYYQDFHHCPYCQTIEREVGRGPGPHFVYKNESFVLLTPYASDWPFELTILPFKHRLAFGNINDSEIKDLAQILQLALKLLNRKLNRPGYNFWFHSVPELFGFAKSSLYYHWHVDLIPRIKPLGGLELGVGVMVDDLISPEKAARELRDSFPEVNPNNLG